MKSIVKHLLYLLPAISTFVSLHCSTGGNVTDGGNILVVDSRVAGAFFNQDGTPAYNATVVMRPRDYLPAPAHLRKRSAQPVFFVCSTTTDRKGEFLFDSITRGTFIIEGTSSDKHYRGFIDSIVADEHFMQSDTCMQLAAATLKPPGSIQGTVRTTGDSAYGIVFVYGFDTYAMIDANGHYFLENLPAGNHRLEVAITVADRTSYASINASAKSQDTTIVDTVIAFDTGDVITFQKTFGGTNEDYGQFVQQTTDGGYVITGFTYSSGVGDCEVYLIKTDAHGDSLWTRTYGGVKDDLGLCVRQTGDNGFIVAGTYNSGMGNSEVYLIKTDADGNSLWTKTFGGSDNDYSYFVQQTSDNGLIIAGGTDSNGAGRLNVYLIKTNAYGDSLWTKTFEGSLADYGSSVQQTTDGGFIITGSFSFNYSFLPSSYVYLMKTNANGDTAWTKTIDTDSNIICNSVQQTTDEGYIIAGYSYVSGPGEDDVRLIKTTANGDMVWTRTCGTTDSEQGNYVQQTTDGGFIITGIAKSSATGNSAVYLLKADATGNETWSKKFDVTNVHGGENVQQTNDGGYIVTGSSMLFNNDGSVASSDVFLIKTDANGNVE